MKKRKTALAIVAHPDDETIWMGGMILKNNNWKWTILSLCRKNDKDRAPKFKKVCRYYKAIGIIGDLDDKILKPIRVSNVIKKIKEFLDEKEFDFVFTHGRNGEYGHLRHKEIHKAVRKMIKDGELKCKKAYYFDYKPGENIAPHNSELRIPVPNIKAEENIKLDDKEFNDKFRLIMKVYGFKENIFETLSCHKMESFDVR